MCVICNHANKNEIESAVLGGLSFDVIASDYELQEDDLKLHCLRHLRIGEIGITESKALTKVKSREMLLLQNSAFSFYLTMKSLEKVIQKKLSDEEIRSIPKSVVDLYLGAGAEMRQAVDSLFKSMNVLSGDGQTGVDALADLVRAIRVSKDKGDDK